MRPYFPRDCGFSGMQAYRVSLAPGVAAQSVPQVGGDYARGADCARPGEVSCLHLGSPAMLAFTDQQLHIVNMPTQA